MIDLVQRFVIPAAYSLLPPKMASPEATAMLLAIGQQESRFEHRVQEVEGTARLRAWWVGGPARGFWQMEVGGGVTGVLTHPASKPYLQPALRKLGYDPDIKPADLHGVIAHNDVLAAICARLLLYTDVHPLPAASLGAEAAWQCYVRVWRPGHPRRETWDAFWREAWRRVVEAAPKAA